MSNSSPTFDIFLIHSFEDMSIVEKIQEGFAQHPRIRVLVAERRRRPGDVLVDKIRELIESCHLVVVVWSPNLEQSITANHEIGYALALNKTIYPLVFSGMRPKGLLEGVEYIACDPVRANDSILLLVEEIRSLASKLGYKI